MFLPLSPQFSSCLYQPTSPPAHVIEGLWSIFPWSLFPVPIQITPLWPHQDARGERTQGPWGYHRAVQAPPPLPLEHDRSSNQESCMPARTLSPSPSVWDSRWQTDSREWLEILQDQRPHFSGRQKKVVKKIIVLWICLKWGPAIV